MLMTAMVWVAGSAGASGVCTQLPASAQNISVSYIQQANELQKVDDLLEGYLRPCMEPLGPDNTKAICQNGRLVAEQVLRVHARVDAAGKHNAFLNNAKMKSYKTGAALLEQMKALAAGHACP
jgi:hypothetical protein